jgi:predicted ATP-dependent serine protease
MIFPLKSLNRQIQSYDQKIGLVSIWGEIGVGKTTFSLQTALFNSSLTNSVIYIYTKQNLPLKKLKTIFQKFDKNILKDNFVIYRILNFSELCDFILELEQIIINLKNEREKAKILIIIDSITNLYQIGLRKNNKSKNVMLNYQLNQILATLSYLNINYPVDVLIVNYLRRLKLENQTIEIQSGGKVMDYWIDLSIKIDRDKKLNYRNFVISAHPEKKPIIYHSKLTKFGFELE